MHRRYGIVLSGGHRVAETGVDDKAVYVLALNVEFIVISLYSFEGDCIVMSCRSCKYYAGV